MGLYIPGYWDTLHGYSRLQYVGSETAIFANERLNNLAEIGWNARAEYGVDVFMLFDASTQSFDFLE